MSAKWIVYSRTYLTIQANVFLSILRNAPLIGALLPPDIYKRRLPKYIASIFGILLDLFKKGLAGNITAFLMIHQIPSWLSKSSNTALWPSTDVSILLFLFLICLAPAISGSKIFKTTSEDHTFLNHFMVEPSSYYRYKTVKDFFVSGLLLAPVLIYLFRDPLIVIFLLISKGCALGLSHVFFLNAYQKQRRIPKIKKRLLFNLLLHLVVYALFLFGLFNGITFSPAVFVSIIALGPVILVFCFRYLVRFKGFKEIAIQYANKDTLSLRVGLVTPLDEDTRGLETDNFEVNKAFFAANKGQDVWSFMDNAFKSRYKRVIRTSNKDKMVTNLVLALIVGLLIRFQILNIDTQNILVYSPKVIPFVFSMTFGGWYLPICFRHMDLPLMYNHLYQGTTIKKSMVQRYLYLLKNGVVLVASLIFSLFLILWINNISIGISDFLKLSLAYALIYIIYETYYVIVYYLLQPYTADLTVKNPVFMVLNWLVGIFNVGVLFAKNNVILLLPALAISLGVIDLLFLVTMKLSSKTFKLRFVEDTPIRYSVEKRM